MLKIHQILIWWKMIFHGVASSFYLLLLAMTYSSGGNVMFVERMVTTWYLIVHILFILMTLGLDLIQLFVGKSSKVAKYFAAFNNIVFISVVFPFGLFVSLTYWCLFYYNCNLILPNIVDMTVPNWVSTSAHSVISLVALLEMIATKYTYKGNYIMALTTMSAFSVSYIMCLVHTYEQFGFWVYPVLHLVPEEELWMVFLALCTTLVALFFSGAGLSFWVHGYNNESSIFEESNFSDKLKNLTPISSTAKPESDKILDSPFDVKKAPSSNLESKSSSQKKILQPQLRDFTSINYSSKDEHEIWHDAIYSPAVASFVENLSRNARKSKPVTRRRIRIGQNEEIGHWHMNHNRAVTVSKPLARDNQKMFQALSTSTPQRTSHPPSQRTFSSTDQMKNKLDAIFRSANQDMSITNFPVPMADDDIATDSLEIMLIPPSSSSLVKSLPEPHSLSENKRKMKKPFSTRKEKSKSITVLFNKNTGDVSRSTTNIPSIGSLQQDFSKTKQEKELVTDEIKSDINVVSGKKDRKKNKEDRGTKRVSKDFMRNSSFLDINSSDRWSYLEIASKRGIGKLDKECLDFETRSLPVDVDDRVGENKRDYLRNVDDEISPSIVLRSD